MLTAERKMDAQEVKKMMEEMKTSMKEIANETVTQVLKSQNTKLTKATERLERKRKADGIQFNKKGHEDQFRHCTELEDTIDDAIELIDDGNIEQAKEKLNEGKKSLKERAKWVRIADREGWLTVKQFRSDDLASDEEEEKRLKRAIRSANALKEKMSKNKSVESSTSTNSNVINNDKKYYRNSESERYSKRMDDVICFNCKRAGHYVNYCPFIKDSKDLPKIPLIEEKKRHRDN